MALSYSFLSTVYGLKKLNFQGHRFTKMCLRRSFSSKYECLKTIADYTYSGMWEVTLSNSPKNLASAEMLRELSKAIKEMENSSNCRGFILGSGIPRQFCKGFSVTEFYEPNAKELKEFYNTLQQTWIDLYGTRLAVVAAIKGHAIGYGCLLTLCCDYRIVGSEHTPYRIGLNEAEIGLVPPPWYRDTVSRVVGSRTAESALSLARLYTEEEALQLGFVDQIVPAEDLRKNARQALQDLLKVPDFARVEAKKQARHHVLQRLLLNRDLDAANFYKTVTSRQVQMTMKKFLASVFQRKVAKRDRLRQDSRVF